MCPEKTVKSLASDFNTLHIHYALCINCRNRSNGPLWRPRFQSYVLDGLCAREDVRSVETIPVSGGFVALVEDYAW